MKGTKSCFNCIHGKLIKGFMGTYYDPPENDSSECQNGNVDWDKIEESEQEHDYIEDKLPLYCGHYEPKMVEKCIECDKVMNIPEHDVEYFCEGDNPACSKECQTKWYAEFDKQFI